MLGGEEPRLLLQVEPYPTYRDSLPSKLLVQQTCRCHLPRLIRPCCVMLRDSLASGRGWGCCSSCYGSLTSPDRC